MEISIEKEELYKMTKTAVKEAFEEELLERFLKNIPYISDEEMKDIIETYGRPMQEKNLLTVKVLKYEMDNSILR